MVLDNPYFAVTDAKGNFEIKNVPAGTQKVVVWQEAVDKLRHAPLGRSDRHQGRRRRPRTTTSRSSPAKRPARVKLRPTGPASMRHRAEVAHPDSILAHAGLVGMIDVVGRFESAREPPGQLRRSSDKGGQSSSESDICRFEAAGCFDRCVCPAGLSPVCCRRRGRGRPPAGGHLAAARCRPRATTARSRAAWSGAGAEVPQAPKVAPGQQGPGGLRRTCPFSRPRAGRRPQDQGGRQRLRLPGQAQRDEPRGGEGPPGQAPEGRDRPEELRVHPLQHGDPPGPDPRVQVERPGQPQRRLRGLHERRVQPDPAAQRRGGGEARRRAPADPPDLRHSPLDEGLHHGLRPSLLRRDRGRRLVRDQGRPGRRAEPRRLAGEGRLRHPGRRPRDAREGRGRQGDRRGRDQARPARPDSDVGPTIRSPLETTSPAPRRQPARHTRPMRPSRTSSARLRPSC